MFFFNFREKDSNIRCAIEHKCYMVSTETLQNVPSIESLSLQESIGCNFSKQKFVLKSSYICVFTFCFTMIIYSEQFAISKSSNNSHWKNLSFGRCTFLSYRSLNTNLSFLMYYNLSSTFKSFKIYKSTVLFNMLSNVDNKTIKVQEIVCLKSYSYETKITKILSFLTRLKKTAIFYFATECSSTIY